MVVSRGVLLEVEAPFRTGPGCSGQEAPSKNRNVPLMRGKVPLSVKEAGTGNIDTAQAAKRQRDPDELP